ncbi:MAG: hypothetical protein U1D97_03840, partial [Desulfuromonadales bacterium]|nr:hypothetical protein [Desulfuromonadales bacterium]
MKSSFRIPDSFLKIVNTDGAASSSVTLSLSKFEPWLLDSGKPFFKGYTEHGVGHINSVLQIAEWLISKESMNQMTPSDVMVLSLAILSHDAAMSLTEDSFRALIRGEIIAIPDLDEK